MHLDFILEYTPIDYIPIVRPIFSKSGNSPPLIGSIQEGIST
jgi:hypothetical protein